MGFFKDILSGRWKKREDERKSRSVEVAPEKGIVAAPAPRRAAGDQMLFGILRASRLTEKSSAAAQRGVHTFVVSLGAGKGQIAEAVERSYGVEVTGVRTARTHGKERRRGRQIGWKPGFKKAMVRLKEGQKIEAQ